jgi:hypothetical protein
MASRYGYKFVASKVYGKNFGLFEKLAMGVFPLCVPYVTKVIKNLFSHFGRFVYVKLKLYPLFGSLLHLYCGAETSLNYINHGIGTASRWSVDSQCSLILSDSLCVRNLLAPMSNFNRKSLFPLLNVH